MGHQWWDLSCALHQLWLMQVDQFLQNQISTGNSGQNALVYIWYLSHVITWDWISLPSSICVGQMSSWVQFLETSILQQRNKPMTVNHPTPDPQWPQSVPDTLIRAALLLVHLANSCLLYKWIWLSPVLLFLFLFLGDPLLRCPCFSRRSSSVTQDRFIFSLLS